MQFITGMVHRMKYLMENAYMMSPMATCEMVAIKMVIIKYKYMVMD